DINAKETVRGQNALMWAAAENNLEATTTLLEGGANVNARTPPGFTALHFAVRARNTAVVKALFERGADVNDPIQPTAVARPGEPAMRNYVGPPGPAGGAPAARPGVVA